MSKTTVAMSVSVALVFASGLLKAEEPYERSTKRLAVSKDGKRIAVASDDNRVRIWDVEDVQLTHVIGLDLPGQSVAFSPDGNTVVAETIGTRPNASVPAHSHLSAWDVSGEQPRNVWKVDKIGIDSSLVVAPDGTWCASISGYPTLEFFDMKSGKLKRSLVEAGNSMTDLGVTPDGKTVVTSGQSYRLWDMTLEAFPESIEPPTDVFMDERVEESDRFVRAQLAGSIATAVASNGKWSVAMGLFDDELGRAINLAQIDLTTGKLVGLIAKGIENVTCMALSPDDEAVALGMDMGEIKLWSVADRKEVASWSFPQLQGARSLAFIESGQQLVVAGRGGNTVLVISVADGKVLRTLRSGE
jgi:WD40 repeat protein